VKQKKVNTVNFSKTTKALNLKYKNQKIIIRKFGTFCENFNFLSNKGTFKYHM